MFNDIHETTLAIFNMKASFIISSLIPQTVNGSIISKKIAADIGNIECGVVGKYIEVLIRSQ